MVIFLLAGFLSKNHLILSNPGPERGPQSLKYKTSCKELFPHLSELQTARFESLHHVKFGESKGDNCCKFWCNYDVIKACHLKLFCLLPNISPLVTMSGCNFPKIVQFLHKIDFNLCKFHHIILCQWWLQAGPLEILWELFQLFHDLFWTLYGDVLMS